MLKRKRHSSPRPKLVFLYRPGRTPAGFAAHPAVREKLIYELRGERIRRIRRRGGSYDRVLIQAEKAEETTKSGIVLTSAAQEKPQISRVIAVGPGGMVDGKEVVMQLKAGDRVITGKYTGTEVKIDGEEYTIVRQSDVLAVVE